MASNRSAKWKLFRQDLNQVRPEVLAEGTPNFMLPRLNLDGGEILYFAESSSDDRQHTGSSGGGPYPTPDNSQTPRKPPELCLLTTYAGSAYQLLSFDPGTRRQSSDGLSLPSPSFILTNLSSGAGFWCQGRSRKRTSIA